MDIDVEGVGPLINRLQKFEKDIYKILQKEIRQGAEQVAVAARRLTPSGSALSGWGAWNLRTGRTGQVGAVTLLGGSRDLAFKGEQVRSRIRAKSKVIRRRRGGIQGITGVVETRDPAGAIYSLAGSRSTSQFGDALNAKHGSVYPRALTPALYEKGPDAMRAIEAAIRRAADAVT